MILAGYILAGLVQSAAPLAMAMLDDPQIGRHLTPALAMEHALAATASATRDVPREALVALAWRESHLNPLSGPRGHWPVAPKRPPVRRVYRCGVLQSDAATWDECVAQRDLFVGYRAGAEQVQRWVTFARRKYHAKNALRAGLNGYAEGGRAAARGYGVKCRGITPTCDRAAIVLIRAARLRASAAHHASVPAW